MQEDVPSERGCGRCCSSQKVLPEGRQQRAVINSGERGRTGTAEAGWDRPDEQQATQTATESRIPGRLGQ